MNIEPIGIIKSCFRQKFGIPRQPGLVPLATATLRLLDNYNTPEMVRGLEAFSHIWLIFEFHATRDKGWKAMVRPPRLGGNDKIGVLATRSMFRPNSLGLSVCKLESVNTDSRAVTLLLSGVDLLDNTPVFDIKPYLPYADSIETAHGAYADKKPTLQHVVTFTDEALAQCKLVQSESDLVALISQILAQDPRPAFQQGKDTQRGYAMQLFDLDIKWHYKNDTVEVVEVVKLLSI